MGFAQFSIETNNQVPFLYSTLQIGCALGGLARTRKINSTPILPAIATKRIFQNFLNNNKEAAYFTQPPCCNEIICALLSIDQWQVCHCSHHDFSVFTIVRRIDIFTIECKRLTDFVNCAYRIFSWNRYIDYKGSHISKF